MEKRLVTAIALSILIIVLFQHFLPKPPSPPTPQSAVQPAAVEPKAAAGAITQPLEPVVGEEETVVESDDLIITFSNIGGAIKKVSLKNYKDSSGGPLELAALVDPATYLYSVSSTSIPGLDKSAYVAKRYDGAIEFTVSKDGYLVMKRYDLRKYKNGIGLQIFIKNSTSVPKELNYRVTGGSGLTETSKQDERFVEVVSYINGKKVGFKRPKDGRIINPGIVEWTALKNKYFAIVLKPFIGTRSQYYSGIGSGSLTTGIDVDTQSIQPGSTIENAFALYVGPANSRAVASFGQGIDEVVDYGFFGIISKGILAVLGFFYGIFKSWGVAIILVSIFLNILLFPLTYKSFQSMQKMHELHPEMEKLKKLHKDNPQKLNKEMMELYRTYKINPLSGCLPMLLQMPIFFALYSALMKSVELRGAHFLWIKDLSGPDAVPLPVTLPLIGNSINILPIVMVVAMVFQQKMSTATMGSAVTPEQKEQQRLMLIIMPIVFGFVFYSMPSGLVLYWVINTALTVVEQSVMIKKEAA